MPSQALIIQFFLVAFFPEDFFPLVDLLAVLLPVLLPLLVVFLPVVFLFFLAAMFFITSFQTLFPLLPPFFVVCISLAQSNQISIYTIASFFGGYYNFLIFMATIGALIIGYAGLRESKEPPVIQVKESDGKTASYRVQGKKIHTTQKGGRSGKRI